MKYDYKTRKPTRGAERTLIAFSSTFYQLASKKSFDTITVQEICNISHYPRATFYNYFEDKFDLAQYCWYRIEQILHLEEHVNLNPEEAITTFFTRLYELFDMHRTVLTNVAVHNPLNSTLFQHFHRYFKEVMQRLFIECFDFQGHPVPLAILADHFSQTLLMMLEWCFLKKEAVTLQKAQFYLQSLLGPLEKLS